MIWKNILIWLLFILKRTWKVEANINTLSRKDGDENLEN